MTEMVDANEFIRKVAEVSAAVGWQANVGAMELAGQIISVLYARPELLPRFMAEGVELFIDGSFGVENGALTYVSIGKGIISPTDFRRSQGSEH